CARVGYGYSWFAYW
nr:immunoglobulin heavy chain junction region [Mus musculus]MBK4189164.1 immunoglobulin heavy chain junction region [Mus musculus]